MSKKSDISEEISKLQPHLFNITFASWKENTKVWFKNLFPPQIIAAQKTLSDSEIQARQQEKFLTLKDKFIMS